MVLGGVVGVAGVPGIKSMSLRSVIAIVALVFLTGCVSQPGADKPGRVSGYGAANYNLVLAETKLMPDPHTGWTKVYGPIVPHGVVPRLSFYAVHARIDGGKTRFTLEIAGLFPKRVYLGDVYSKGRKLKSKVLDRERTDCGYSCTTVETVAVDLSRTDMDIYAAEGITVKIVGRRDDLVVSVPAAYFAAVLAFYSRQVEQGAA